METRIGKWGNSLALRIPQSVAARVGITLNAAVELTPRGEDWSSRCCGGAVRSWRTCWPA